MVLGLFLKQKYGNNHNMIVLYLFNNTKVKHPKKMQGNNKRKGKISDNLNK